MVMIKLNIDPLPYPSPCPPKKKKLTGLDASRTVTVESIWRN